MRRKLRYSLEYGALRAAETLVPLLPPDGLRLLAAGLGELVWRFDRRGRHVIGENLRVAFGDALDDAGRQKLVRANYRSFARTFSELFWTRRLRAADWDRHFVLTCDTPEAADAFRNGGCIFATAHFGNFEWLSMARALGGGPTMIIAQDFRNPPLTDIFRRLRSMHSQTIIPQEGAMLKLFKHLKKGGSAAALVDLNADPDQSATVIRCFGMRTCISVLHVALAARTGRPIVPSLAIPRRDGRWEMRFFAPFRVDPDAGYAVAAQRCWDVFEPVFRDHPAAWMWLYKHWRYLPEGTDPATYPDYANRSKRFDRLCRRVDDPTPG